MAPVSEKIDVRILRLLGLTDVFDLDYDTYLTLIREAMVTGAKRLPPEELAILANERKRVRGKKGRFKPRQKINATNVATTKFLKPSVQPISTPLLPASVGEVQTPQVQTADLSPLQGPLESIKKTLSNFFNFRKDASDDERRAYEQQKRSKREAGLEGLKKGIGAVAEVTKKFVAPFQGIIDRIWRFIFFTLLGRAFTQLMDWFQDPKNQKKIETLQRFLKDWWPALLAAATLFLTPFGKFVRGVLSTVGGLAGKLVSQIPKIGGAIKSLSRVLLNPWVAIPAAAVGLAAAANAVTGQQKAAPVQVENKARAQTGEGLGVQGTDTMTDAVPSVGNMGPTTPYGLLQGAARGGSIMDLMNGYFGIDKNTGHSISGFGPDTQLIAAMPGEVVINKSTVDALGSDTFLSLNRYYGGSGANQPSFKRFKSGGLLAMKSGGVVKPNNRNSLPDSIRSAQMRMLDKQSQINANIKTNIRPWWERLNPFAERRPYGLRLPSHSPESRNYNMPGYNRNSWLEMERFRDDSSPLKPNPNNPIRYAPSYPYQKPGVNKPLLLQSGGLVRAPQYKLPRELGGGGGGTDAITEQEEILSRIIPNRLGRYKPFDKNRYDPQRYQSGGLVGDSLNNLRGTPVTGYGRDTRAFPITGGGNGVLQPGEFVVKKPIVDRIGPENLNFLNENKFFINSKTYPEIKPLSRGRNTSTITLPPINSSGTGGNRAIAPASTQVPLFSATSIAGASTRAQNAIIYGIVE